MKYGLKVITSNREKDFWYNTKKERNNQFKKEWELCCSRQSACWKIKGYTFIKYFDDPTGGYITIKKIYKI